MSTKVRIHTTQGDITVRLYDETPLHRDNFIKLAKEGYYDGTLFHRVIANFMIPRQPSGTRWKDVGRWWPRLYHRC